jgi:hypothetical protein
MANTLTFSRGSTSVTVTPVPGSLRAGGGHDDRGGGTIPAVRAGYAANGSCQVVVTAETATDMQHTLAELLSLVSEVGAGDVTVKGAGIYADVVSYSALVDVTIGGDSVQTADVTWKGTYNGETA